MDKKELLISCVGLYRAYKAEGLCTFEDGHLKVNNIEVTEDVIPLLSGLDFVRLYKNGNYDQQESPVFYPGDKITFAIVMSSLIYANINDFIDNFSQVQKGILPEDCYFIDNDLLLSEDNEIGELKNLVDVCNLIDLLRNVLPHTEDIPINRCLKFVLFSKEKDAKKIDKKIFTSRFNYSDLAYKLPNLGSLLELKKEGDLHTYERISVLQNALYELLKEEPDEKLAFSYLIRQFKRLFEIYINNYETYINNFHLADFKKEIVESYSKFSDEIDNQVNNLVTKFFAIPAASTAILFLKNDTDSHNNFLIGSILMVVFLLTLMQVYWSLDSFCRIEENIKEVFKKFDGKEEEGALFVANKKDALLNRLIKASFRAYSFLAISFVLCLIVMIGI